RHGLGPRWRRLDALAPARDRGALARGPHLLALDGVVRGGALRPRIRPDRRPELRVRPAPGPDHRRPRPRRGDPDDRQARGAHAADNWSVYADRPLELVAFWNGGIGTTGAPVGSTIAGLVAARWLRLPIGFMFDISVIGIALGEAIGRIGDIINGEHHAVACGGLPWCVRYTHPATLGQADYVHPVVAYDGLAMLLIFVILVAYWRRVRGRPPEGRVYFLYLLLFGGMRFVTSFVRQDPIFLFGMQEGQLLGL